MLVIQVNQTQRKQGEFIIVSAYIKIKGRPPTSHLGMRKKKKKNNLSPKLDERKGIIKNRQRSLKQNFKTMENVTKLSLFFNRSIKVYC